MEKGSPQSESLFVYNSSNKKIVLNVRRCLQKSCNVSSPVS